MMKEHGSQLEFSEYVSIVWRRRRIVLLAAGIFACVTFIAFNFIPRRYTAQSVFERKGDIVSANTSKGMPASFSTYKAMLGFDLAGAPAVAKALTKLGYADHLPKGADGRLTADGSAELERMAGTVRRGIRPTWIIKSAFVDRVSVTMTSTDPILAYTLPNQLVNDYIATTRQRMLGQLSGSEAFLERQIADARQKTSDLREERYNYLKGHPNMLPEDPQFLMGRIGRLDNQLEDLQRRREGLERRLEDATLVANPEYVDALAQLAQLQTRLVQMETELRMTKKHPKVVKLKQAIAETTAKLSVVPDRIVARDTNRDRPITTAEAIRLEDLRASLERLDIEVTRKQQLRTQCAEAQANSLPVAREYQRLTHLIEQAEADVALWQKNVSVVRIAHQAEQNGTRTHLKMVKAAAPVYRPSWPALWHVFTLALGGGLAFGIFLSIIMTRLSRTFASADEAGETLGLPLLGVVGSILSPAARRVRAIRRYILAPAAVALLLLIIVLAASSVVMSANYPGEYARIMERLGPTTRAMCGGGQVGWTASREKRN